MSLIITTIQTIFAPVLDVSLVKAFKVSASAFSVAALLLVFKPLLLGMMKASMLLIKPRLNKEQRLERRQMRDAMMLTRMLNAMDGAGPSHAAELRALASRA